MLLCAMAVFALAGLGTAQAGIPYKTHTVPGIIEAEDFDQGGEGVGYHIDAPPSEPYSGAINRPAEGTVGEYGWDSYEAGAAVFYREDAEFVCFTSPLPGQIAVNQIHRLDWYEYTFQVTEEGDYNIIVRGAAQYSDWLDISIDGVKLADGNVSIWGTQSTNCHYFFDSFFTNNKAIHLTAGEHVLNFTLTSDNASVAVDKIEFFKTDNTAYEGYDGAALSVPAMNGFDPSNFDAGGLYSAYYVEDATQGGNKNSARTDESVPVRQAEDYGDGDLNYVILKNGDWLKYTIDVTEKAGYDFFFEGIASGKGNIYIFNQQSTIASAEIAATDSWGPIFEFTRVPLETGKLTLRFQYQGSGELSIVYGIIEKHIAPAPVGYWRFDNPADLLAPGEGSSEAALPMHLYTSNHGGIGDQVSDGLQVIEGPLPGLTAARIPLDRKLKVRRTTSDEVIPAGEGRVGTYTMLWDVKAVPTSVSGTQWGRYTCLLSCLEENGGDGSVFIQPVGRCGMANQTKTTPIPWFVGQDNSWSQPGQPDCFGNPLPSLEESQALYGSEWVRIVISLNNTIINTYVNGIRVLTENLSINESRQFLGNYFWIYGDENGEDFDIDCAKFVLWEDAVSIADLEELQLGGDAYQYDLYNTAIKGVAANSGKVYAADGQLHVEGYSPAARVEVYSLAGQKLASVAGINGKTVNLAAKGLYVVKVTDNGRSEGFKVSNF